MKRIVLIGFVTLAFIGCTLSPEKKATSLVEKVVKNSLYHPDSYDPIETVIDSAFAPFDDPEFYNKTLELSELSANIEQYNREMTDAKTSMALWNSSYGNAYMKAKYQEAEAEYDMCAKQIEVIQQKAEKLAAELWTQYNEGKQFIGWKATHNYRANNNAGQTLIGEGVFILDHDMTEILAGYNTDDNDYKRVQMMYKMMEATIEAEPTPAIE